MMDKTRSLAEGKWESILPALGVDKDFLANRPGPCPMCGGKDRFRFDDKGKGLWFCQQCRAGDGFSLLMGINGYTFAEAAAEVDGLLKMPDNNIEAKSKPKGRDPRRLLRKLAAGMTRSVEGTNTEAYLSSRGLAPSPVTRHISDVAYFEDGRWLRNTDAMAHYVCDSAGAPATIHMTYLESGRKADVKSAKKLMPSCQPWRGGAVRLYPLEGSEVMGIAEGIETAMACHKQFSVPVWASVNADNMAEFVPPPGVREILIFGDNDASYTGHAVSYTLARKLKGRGYEVSVHIPLFEGQDWADAFGGES